MGASRRLVRIPHSGVLMVIERDEHGEWRAAHPAAALNEAVSLAIGCILTHELDEAKRKAAIDVLIECHRRALVEFAFERRLH
jgi:hypothetical protein